MSEEAFTRRQVSAGELGQPVRFEIQTAEGWVIRFEGEEAAEHMKALDAACAIAGIHGMRFPTPLPLVGRPDLSERDAKIAELERKVGNLSAWNEFLNRATKRHRTPEDYQEIVRLGQEIAKLGRVIHKERATARRFRDANRLLLNKLKDDRAENAQLRETVERIERERDQYKKAHDVQRTISAAFVMMAGETSDDKDDHIARLFRENEDLQETVERLTLERDDANEFRFTVEEADLIVNGFRQACTMSLEDLSTLTAKVRLLTGEVQHAE